MKIAVRMGHQRTGKDGGAVGIRDEVSLIREYAPYVIQGLKSLGYEVLDVTPPENNRTLSDSLMYGINKANEWKADLFVSLHGNAFNGKAHGCEVVYLNGSNKSKEYAEKIVKSIAELGFYNRGAKSDVRGLAELKHTKMPAVIVEPLFIDSEVDMKLYDPKKIGYAIVKGITGKTVEDKLNIANKTNINNQTQSNLQIKINYQLNIDIISRDNKTYIPVRAFCERLGHKVEWDSVNNKVLIDGKVVTFEMKPLVKGSNYAHIRDLATFLNLDVEWNEANKLITLK